VSEQQQTRKVFSKSTIRWASLDRRRFLVGISRGLILAATALVVEQIVRFLAFQPAREASTTIVMGLPKTYPRNRLIYVEPARAYVGNDRDGLYVLDAVCPHLGCLVEKVKDGSFKCPCHGSRFDSTGKAKTGPATESLRYLSLWLDQDGQLVVDRAKAVDPATRLIV
jgi:cytochrome b6-f complex iron-sulfur subunit